MARPSHSWTGFDHLDPDSEQRKQMQELCSSANFEYLNSRAVTTRRSKESVPQDISCDIEFSRFTSGFNNVVFEARFSDGVYWIVRIQIAPVIMDKDGKNISMTSEIATMKFVRNRTTVPVPEVFDYETTPNNPFAYPYMLMECMPGRTCDDILAMAVPAEHIGKVAKQLANVFFELQNLTFDRIGRVMMKPSSDNEFELIPPESDGTQGPPPYTSLEYFHEERRAENAKILALHPNDADWATAAWILKIAIDHMVLDDRVHGPFPLAHLDLHYGNLLFDEEFNLTGVLDWSHAQTAPLERLAVFPEFMTVPLLSEEENKLIIEFRDLFIRFLKEKEALGAEAGCRDDAHTPLSEFMGSARAKIAYFCTYSNSNRALWDAKRACKLMFGEVITWELLREVYGTKPLCLETKE